MGSFVVVVDMQRDFVAPDGALPVPGADALVGPMHAWLASLRHEGVAGVLFTQDTHDAETYAWSEEAKAFPLHCERGGPGWELAVDPTRLDPAIPRHRLEKGVFDMWAEADVFVEPVDGSTPVARDAFFARLHAAGVRDVVVVGVAADYCVRWAVEGLVERGFRVAVPAGLTRGIARNIDEVAAAEWADAAVVVA